MKNEKRKKLRRVFSWIAVIAIIVAWVFVILDINVWRHLTGAAATVDWVMATFITVSLASLAANLK